jgi:hypothetical protein
MCNEPHSLAALPGPMACRVVCVLLSLGGASCAHPYHEAPAPLTPTALAVASERDDVSCVGDDRRVVCRVSTAAQVVNPTPVIQGAELRMRTTGLEPRATLDNQPVASSLAPLSRDFAIQLSPSRTAVLGSSAELEMAGTDQSMLSTAPLLARHPWLGEDAADKYAGPLQLCPSSHGRWSRAGGGEIQVRSPRRWELQVGPTWTGGGDADTRLPISAAASCVDMRWHREGRAVPIYHGGPAVGVGGTFGHGLWMRAGYEAGLWSWAILGAHAETDGRKEVVVAPTAEAASDSVIVFPSASAGLAAPVRVRPDRAVGVRAQVSLMLVAGVVGWIEYWPSEDVWRETILAQMGF